MNGQIRTYCPRAQVSRLNTPRFPRRGCGHCAASLVGAWLHPSKSASLVWLWIGALGVPHRGSIFRLEPYGEGIAAASPAAWRSAPCAWVGTWRAIDWEPSKRTGLYLARRRDWCASCGAGLARPAISVMPSFPACLMGPLFEPKRVARGSSGCEPRPYPPAAHQGLALGIAASGRGQNSGTVLAMFFAPRVSQLVGWHGVFGLTDGSSAGDHGIILFWLASCSRTRTSRARSGIGCGGKDLGPRCCVSTVGLLARAPLYAVTFGGFVGLCSMPPDASTHQYGLDMVSQRAR